MEKILVTFFSLLLFSFSNVCLGEELIFPFTVDQNTKSEDITQIPAERDIQTDKWLMSPPTRLELITYAADQYFQRDFAEKWEVYGKDIEKNFEPRARGFSIRGSAMVQFNSNMDVFYAGVTIDNLGKPKKPMKEVCSQVLNSIIFHSLEGGGYSYQNTFFGPFIQTSPKDPEVTRIVQKLQKNFLLSVTLQASFDKEQNVIPRDFYVMRCYKFAGEKEVHYQKQSLRLNR